MFYNIIMKIILFIFLFSSNLALATQEEFNRVKDLEVYQMSHYEREILYKYNHSLLDDSIGLKEDIKKVNWKERLEDADDQSAYYNAFSLN